MPIMLHEASCSHSPDRWRWAGPLLIAVALTLMLALTWNTWADALVDFGREAYVPWQITQGKVLYRDIAYFNGPLSPYFNALAMELLGATLGTLFTVNIVILCSITYMLYWLLTQLSSRLAATVATLFFTSVLAVGHYMPLANYNYVAPYSHEMTHGLALSLAAWCLLLQWRRHERRWQLAGTGALVGLTLLTKVEVAAATALAATIWVILLAAAKPRPNLCRDLGAYFTAMLAVPLAAWSLLTLQLRPLEAALGVAGSWRWVIASPVAGTYYYRFVYGTLNFADNFNFTAWWLGAWAMLIAPALLTSWLLVPPRQWNKQFVGLGCMLVAIPLLLTWEKWRWMNAARPLPLILILLLICSIIATRREVRARSSKTEQYRLWLERSILLLWSLLLLAKIFLNVRVFHYGFGLAMPGIMLVVIALVDWIPAWLRKHGKNGDLFTSMILAGLAVVAYVHVRFTDSLNQEQTYQFIHPNGAMLLHQPQGEGIANLLELLEALPPKATLAVLPEGPMINFLSRRSNPTPYYNLMPPEWLMYGPRNIQRSFAEHPPDFIVLVHRDTSDYGVRFFGRDYAQPLMRWVLDSYLPVWQFGAIPMHSDRFGMWLMKRVRR